MSNDDVRLIKINEDQIFIRLLNRRCTQFYLLMKTNPFGDLYDLKDFLQLMADLMGKKGFERKGEIDGSETPGINYHHSYFPPSEYDFAGELVLMKKEPVFVGRSNDFKYDNIRIFAMNTGIIAYQAEGWYEKDIDQSELVRMVNEKEGPLAFLK